MTDLNIPHLDPRMLATTIPTTVFGGGTIHNPAETLVVWRSCRTQMAQGATICFYLSDDRLELLWTRADFYTRQFVQAGVQAAVEVDFSLWSDMPAKAQQWNIFRTRWLGRAWQDAGVPIIPNLNWSGERSYSFAFEGIPKGCPLVACEARTAGSTDEDRRAFLRGLEAAVRQLTPQAVLVYGGKEHEWWLREHLPKGPAYSLVGSFMSVRRGIRAAQARNKDQLELFA